MTQEAFTLSNLGGVDYGHRLQTRRLLRFSLVSSALWTAGIPVGLTARWKGSHGLLAAFALRAAGK